MHWKSASRPYFDYGHRRAPTDPCSASNMAPVVQSAYRSTADPDECSSFSPAKSYALLIGRDHSVKTPASTPGIFQDAPGPGRPAPDLVRRVRMSLVCRELRCEEL